MKKFLIIIFYLSLSCDIFSQNEAILEFLAHLDTTSDLRAKVDLLSDSRFLFSNPDSCFAFAQRGLKLAQAINYGDGEFQSHAAIAFSAWALGDFETAIKLGYKVQEYALSKNDTSLFLMSMTALVHGYRDQGDYREALKLTGFDKIDDETYYLVPGYFSFVTSPDYYSFVASCYYGLEKYDSALYYLDINRKMNHEQESGWSLLTRGRTLEKLNDDAAAYSCYKRSIISLQYNSDGLAGAFINYKDLAGALINLASLFNKMELADSAVVYAKQGLKVAQERKFNKEKAEAYSILSSIYENMNTNEALRYLKLANEAANSLFNQEKQRRITSFRFNEELRQQEIRAAELEFKNKNQRLWIFSIAGALFFALIVALILYRNIRNKQKAKQEIELAYTRLKATQAQLIQSEKMASLGQLTAGIAHEIQNPLNFINNFSEVNNDLFNDLKIAVANNAQEEIEAIFKDLKENENKISNHGKRAEAIVKNMLLHSRGSSGHKEPTNINALCEECLRLSYHGFRAKDKSFNAGFKLEADESLPKIKVVPQDIGRVLLNLINNAFYAVSLKAAENSKNYNPEVIVHTKHKPPFDGTAGQIEVKISDNGPGIPDSIKDKIFQPFFSTKPSGQGTGLGLSLSYDIVKAHGGELNIDTKSEEGGEFVIRLPEKL